MKKQILISFYLIVAINLASAQEVCNNGIDDDSDGLIDLNDVADCTCSGIGGGSSTVTSLIPNPSFENMACCPSSYSQVNCASGWIQASTPTSDYMNTCGFVFGAATSAGLVPFPDGNGILGTIFSPGWQEYVGSCLSSPMLAGTSYTLEFNLASTPIDGGGDVCNGGVIDFSNIDITLFGATNCSSLPYSGNDCPMTVSGWQTLGFVNYNPSPSWGVVSITFTPTTNINAIILGSPCTLPPTYQSPPSGCYPYFYYDNLILNTTASFTPITITSSGGICTGDASATASAGTSGGTWQWYFNGVAISGQTSATINVSAVGLGAGDYTAVYTLSGNCDMVTTTFNAVIPDPTITPAGPFCNDAGIQTLTAASTGGTWSASCGTCINSSTGQFDPSLATIGNNTITYSYSGPCASSDSETISVQDVQITGTTVTDALCFGSCDGQIVINSIGATQFSINGGASFQASNTFTGLCAATYSVVIQNAIGCQETTSITIQSPTALTLPTSFVDETCFGSCDGTAIVAPQGGTAPYDYSWSNGAASSPTNNDLCAGIYTVTVTDDNGCANTASITISSPPQVVINSISSTEVLCVDDCNGTITIDALLATEFSIDGGINFQPLNTFTGLCVGMYPVVVQNSVGCQDTGSINVDAPNPLIITPGINSTICVGQSAVINASTTGGTGTVSIIWDNGLPNGSSHSVSPIVTTIYTVYAEDQNGCQTPPVQITVTVHPLLQVTAQSDVAICLGETATISASASGGNGGPYSYIWDDGSGNLMSGSTQVVSPASTTTYTVTATDNCGTPVATDNITITINPTPTVVFSADTLQGCFPVSVNFTNNTNAADVGTCFWDFGDGATSDECNPNHVFTIPGCYDVTLAVTSPFGCPGSSVINDLICVFGYPEAEFSMGPQPTNLYETLISFTNMSTDATTYFWDFGLFGTSTQSTPSSVLYPDTIPGTYPVCLIATSPDNCVDTVCHDIIIDDVFILYVPNTFTPDNDGINDLFYPVINGIDPESYELLIFNRWGEIIFESTSPGSPWDGTHRSLNCKEDTYVWKLILKDTQLGKKRLFYGHVNLLR